MKHSLSKYIAQAGVCSRRQATELIKAGNVRVDGHVITEPGHKVSDNVSVTVRGKRVLKQEKIYLLMNKPKGYITTVSDEKGRKTVMELLVKNLRSRIYPVGRLDRQTTGLLFFTNDGYLSQQLAHPRHRVQKIYVSTLNKALTGEHIQAIKRGVYLPDGRVKIDSVVCMAKSNCTRVKLVLHSGRYRVVRRLFEALGYDVTALDRIEYAGLKKGTLKQGETRRLTDKEVLHLKNLPSVQ
jgi:23S rRNA pseudouridine2605 synthase